MANFIPNQNDYKNLTPFKTWLLLQINTWGQNNFPFVESDFDELTNYGMMQKLMNAVNDVISNENMVEEDMTNIFNAFTELQNYVNSYFDNLDVQDEINNKLDEMAEDGSLTNLIKDYVDPIYQAYETSINGEIEEFESGISARVNALDTKISSAVDISPIPVASVDLMTNTNRIYLNTTNGKWYYYNGTAWVDGGTYQSDGVGNKAVSYNELSNLINKNILKVVTPSDLIWLQGVGRWQGNLVGDATTLTSQCFLVSKGTTITINSETLRSRFTYYDLSGGYLGNTGSYANRQSYTFTQDCIVSICVALDGATQSDIVPLISCQCLLYNKEEIEFNYYNTYTTRIESEAIYTPKGTKIKLTDYGIYNSDNNMSDAIAYIGVNKYGFDKYSHEYINYGLDTSFGNQEITIDEDCYARIYIRKKWNGEITENDISIFENMVVIDRPLKYDNNFIDTSKYRVYISNNGKIELFTEEQYAYFRIVDPSNKIIVQKDTETIYEKTFTQILEDLSSYAVEYNGHNYIRLQFGRALYFSLFDNELKLANLGSQTIGEKNLYLLVNAWGNILNCELLTIYLKQNINNSNIFNSINYSQSINWKNAVQSVSEKLNTTSNNVETFTFFTDPHLMGYNNSTDFSENLETFVGTLQKCYNSAPMNFIVGGGDWINNGDSVNNACFKLGYVDGFMNSMFKNYYALLGNHDTNYQGTEELSQTTINNLWFRKQGKAYYKFDGINTKCYCLDSGKDISYNTMNSYRWEQIDWLGNQLISDNPSNAIILSHIIIDGSDENFGIQPFADNFTKLANAFNNHTTITLNSITYDFTNCTGHIHYCLGGHTHYDYSNTYNNVLCIVTTTFGYGTSIPTFDMIVNDYDNHKAYFTRVGNGNSREFNI